jgi:hypothetical protein
MEGDKMQTLDFGAWLHKAVASASFCELHTHLMGMGSWNFWINTVMRTVIPAAVKKGHVEAYKGKDALTFETVLSTQPDVLPFDGAPSTFDVVYSYDNHLMKALNRTSLGDLANLLGVDPRELTKTYKVWNARKQVLEDRTGITNTRLLELLDEKQGSDLEKCLRNCFTMLDIDGEAANNVTIKSLFHGRFDPQFFPMRYVLKDAMYEQYLEVLDALLDHIVAKIFRPGGVGYVEFSVGHGDMTRPWVFKHLYAAAEKHEKDGVVIRYLVGFQRSATPVLDLSKKSLLQLLMMCNDRTIYKQSLSMLWSLEKVLVNHAAAKKFMEVVVGFDYMSDEKSHPFCPFGLSEFIEFVKECRRKWNEKFGFRYHCGEIHVESSHERAHMAISARIIRNILEKFSAECPIPLRIGHGVGFLAFENAARWIKDFDALDEYEREVVPALHLMEARRIPIEVNLRSNEILVIGRLGNFNAVKRLTDMRIPVVFCTDNDGIWEVDEVLRDTEQKHVSIAAEFARAINKNEIRSYCVADQFVANGQLSVFNGNKPAGDGAYPILPEIVTEKENRFDSSLADWQTREYKAHKTSNAGLVVFQQKEDLTDTERHYWLRFAKAWERVKEKAHAGFLDPGVTLSEFDDVYLAVIQEFGRPIPEDKPYDAFARYVTSHEWAGRPREYPELTFSEFVDARAKHGSKSMDASIKALLDLGMRKSKDKRAGSKASPEANRTGEEAQATFMRDVGNAALLLNCLTPDDKIKLEMFVTEWVEVRTRLRNPETRQSAGRGPDVLALRRSLSISKDEWSFCLEYAERKAHKRLDGQKLEFSFKEFVDWAQKLGLMGIRHQA